MREATLKAVANESGRIRVVFNDIDVPVVYVDDVEVVVIDVNYHWKTDTDVRASKSLEVVYMDPNDDPDKLMQRTVRVESDIR
ncbi:hypothetical protein [Weissella minor]|uniref:hypothetical protein n=1 Tax=Weissella minor TaxID=1620 RepID=UPI003AF24F6D